MKYGVNNEHVMNQTVSFQQEIVEIYLALKSCYPFLGIARLPSLLAL